MARITNDADMTLLLIKDFKSIVDEITNTLYEKLQKNIETIVYDAGTPLVYNRNKKEGGLLGSFYKEKTKINNLTITGKIDQNPDSMIHNPNKFIHGSNYWKHGDDVREILADIVRAGMEGDGDAHVGKLFGEGFWTEPRDFWQPLIDMIENGDVDKEIENAMNARGIVWKKVI